jgi:LPS-assembly lipoprotein
MLSSEVTRWGRALGFGALALGAMALGGCQVQPLYGAAGGQNQSVTISAASSRVSQVVRNELVLGFGGERADGAYVLDISASSSIGGILPGGLDNEFSAARATVTATYVLKSASDR